MIIFGIDCQNTIVNELKIKFYIKKYIQENTVLV